MELSLSKGGKNMKYNQNVPMASITDENLDKASGGTLEWGLCEFNNMDAQECPVGSYAITEGNWWYQCKAADETHETNYLQS